MSKEKIEYSQEERIEILKSKLGQVIGESNLSISVIYYILQDYVTGIKDLYNQYQNQIIQSLNSKLQYNEEIDSHEKIEEELKKESPDLKVTTIPNDKEENE